MGRLGFTTNNTKTGMGGCSGICWDPGPSPAHPRDRNRDRDKNLQDSPGTEIPRDNKSRLSGAICVPLNRHACSAGQAGPGQKIAGLSCPVPCPSLYVDIFYRSIYLLESVIKDCDYIIRSNCT